MRQSDVLKSFLRIFDHTVVFFFFQAEDGIRDSSVTGVQTCALPIFGDWARNGFHDCGFCRRSPRAYAFGGGGTGDPVATGDRSAGGGFVPAAGAWVALPLADGASSTDRARTAWSVCAHDGWHPPAAAEAG